MHKHAIWDTWKKRASLRYKDLMYEVTTGEYGRGLRIVGTVCPTSSAEGKVGRYTIRQVLGVAKYQELKANVECLHIETGSPISTDK
ncbi:hypothetical protein M9H77_18450 [Catharanthus roseus]|uniref:Uncharacterized protein n=1 Tax=Catharanthus roseus TaxID=4058 RepID=A0ACC0B7G3_CATRO|nr:hypothetical protein M9H77_18450 [Catharanthus roseus]